MHLAVLLWSITAILGKLISLAEFPLVWFRMLITSLVLLMFPSVFNALKRYNFRQTIPLLLTGVIVAIHWVAFYGAIKLTNASVAVACLGTSSVFAAILEPLILKSAFNKSDILLGSGMTLAIYLISNASPEGFFLGICLGVFAAFLAALFSILNKKYSNDYPATYLTFAEMSGGWLFLTLILPFYIHFKPGYFHLPDLEDTSLLLVLSIACTIVPFTLSILALRHISAFTGVFIVNLEPLYTIIIAAVFLQEHKEVNLNFYFGVILITLLMIINTAYKSRQKA